MLWKSSFVSQNFAKFSTLGYGGTSHLKDQIRNLELRETVWNYTNLLSSIRTVFNQFLIPISDWYSWAKTNFKQFLIRKQFLIPISDWYSWALIRNRVQKFINKNPKHKNRNMFKPAATPWPARHPCMGLQGLRPIRGRGNMKPQRNFRGIRV